MRILEAAIGFAVLGSILAVSVPAFVHDLHGSHFVEAIDGLHRIGNAAVAGASDKAPPDAFPPSVTVTPATPPRGKLEADDPLIWDQPTWKALAFKPVPDGVSHAFAFGFDRAVTAQSSAFLAHAHADLDGDGNVSTFEMRGHADERGATLDSTLRVSAELE